MMMTTKPMEAPSETGCIKAAGSAVVRRHFKLVFKTPFVFKTPLVSFSRASTIPSSL